MLPLLHFWQELTAVICDAHSVTPLEHDCASCDDGASHASRLLQRGSTRQRTERRGRPYLGTDGGRPEERPPRAPWDYGGFEECSGSSDTAK